MWRVEPGDVAGRRAVVPPRPVRQHRRHVTPGRINEAYERDDPQKLIDTIYQNFGINTDHFVQVDFCAFQTLVDAVDGVAVPFDTLIRDENTGLNVTETGCYTFDGDHALAYVRSRKLEYLDADGKWTQDPTSDLGRISRQQDFLRRTVARLLSKGAFDPGRRRWPHRDRHRVHRERRRTHAAQDVGVRRRHEQGRPDRDQDVPDQRDAQDDLRAAPCSSRPSTATTCRRSSRCSAARRPSRMPRSGARHDDRAARSERHDRRRRRSSPTPTVDRHDRRPSTTLPSVVAEQNTYGVVPDPNISC